MRIHATAIVLDETGILLRGPAGSGKSSLGSALIGQAARAGRFGRLVADDAVRVEALSGRLVARPHPAVAGLLEQRGIGIVGVDHAPACVIRLVVDLLGRHDPSPARYPEPDALSVSIAGITLPRVLVPSSSDLNGRLVTIVGALTTFRVGS